MNRREFLRRMGVAGASVAAGACFNGFADNGGRKPNILFIFADDQSFEAIHALGCDEVQTPNLDRLVRRGVTFTHTYNMGAWHGAVCVASRTMLVTGAFLWDAKRWEENAHDERRGRRLWPQLLADAGYTTYLSGKWHVKIDSKEVFHHVVHERPGMPNDSPEGYNRPVEGREDVWTPWDTQYGGYWKGGKHWSEVLADDAAAFLDQAGGRDEPFFIYLAFNAPHDPRQSPKEYVERYPLDGIAVPENFLPEYPYKDAIGCGKDLRDERLAPFPRTKHAVKTHRREYYAIITHMDAQIGRILDALEATGKADNTYIFFTADNGLAVGCHGLFGKQNMYDHSMRVPLIMAGPGMPQGQRLDAPVYLQDIMPTTLDLAGVETPDTVSFRSLLPLARGERSSSYDAIYGGYMDLQRMVCADGFKLVYYPEADATLLFDLKNDPLEMNNIADRPEYQDKRATLWSRLKALQGQVGDVLTLP